MDITVRLTDADAQAAFVRSLRESGFAVVTHHPIEARLVDETYAEWAAFFDSVEKQKYRFDPRTYAGYYPYKTENAKGRAVKDLKEFFHVYGWSALPDGISDRTRRLFEALETLAATLLGWIEDDLPPALRSRLSMPLRSMIEQSDRTVLRVLHYPPLDLGERDGAVRASAHEDINLLTLLPAGTAPGLELLDANGRWLAVECEPSSIVVNAGDMLQLATGGAYRSTTHRVINPVGEDRARSRYSMPLFLHPRPEVRLSPERTAGEYLDERLAEIGFG